MFWELVGPTADRHPNTVRAANIWEFPKLWGYPQSSSIFIHDFPPAKTIQLLWYPPFLETRHVIARFDSPKATLRSRLCELASTLGELCSNAARKYTPCSSITRVWGYFTHRTWQNQNSSSTHIWNQPTVVTYLYIYIHAWRPVLLHSSSVNLQLWWKNLWVLYPMHQLIIETSQPLVYGYKRLSAWRSKSRSSPSPVSRENTWYTWCFLDPRLEFHFQWDSHGVYSSEPGRD